MATEILELTKKLDKNGVQLTGKVHLDNLIQTWDSWNMEKSAVGREQPLRGVLLPSMDEVDQQVETRPAEVKRLMK